ncbi:recombinase zinc beta ribbon domain-containing protein [Nocardia sp. NPDC052566]|uniref:recombinase zinc beta ribbon domain-containing protein n=1 Tax=Nocardia sp. NPDC052566 TaxID=3364330 RepID=UPI0037C4FCB2
MPLSPKDLPGLVAIIQARVSKAGKHKSERSPKEQIAWGRGECRSFGWPVGRVIDEGAVGATRHARKDRPGREELRQELTKVAGRVKRGEVPGGVLVNWSSSRANRKVGDMAELRDLCAEFGVYWYYAGVLYDMNDPDDRRRVAQDAVEDEHAPERNRLDSMRALAQNFADGKPHGPESFGFRIAYRRGRSLGREHCPENAPVFREMARRALNLENTYQIARWLTAQEVLIPSHDKAFPCSWCSVKDGRRVVQKVDRRTCPCPKGWRTTWDSDMVKRVLLNEAAAGLRVHEDEDGNRLTVKGTWVGLISLDDHDRLKLILNAPERGSHRGSEPVWLLSGILRCGRCGSAVVHRQRPERGRYYVCRKGGCVTRMAELVEDFVEEVVLRRLEDPTLLQSLTRTDEGALAALDEARKLRAAYEKWLNDAVDADLTPAEIAVYKAKKNPILKAAERRAQEAVPMPHVVAAAGDDARRKWNDPEQTPLMAKRDIIRSLVNVTILSAVGKRKGFGGGAGIDTIRIERRVG